MMARMLRRAMLICALPLALAAAVPALASTSNVELWQALGNNVVCGIAIHPVNSPPMQILCSSRSVPPPKRKSEGDPGNVFLASSGRPQLARLSQDTFVGTHFATLAPGTTWGNDIGPVKVVCRISATAVRCANPAGHGFTITRHSYRAF
jgi:hypothetical protein